MQLPVVHEEGGLAPPEFGFATSSPSAVPQTARGLSLTWEAMRQVGAGFWLTDQQVMLHAALSFAMMQDPKVCGGKKTVALSSGPAGVWSDPMVKAHGKPKH